MKGERFYGEIGKILVLLDGSVCAENVLPEVEKLATELKQT